MTKQEKSLLLYLETRAVDHGGRVDTRRMNKEDMFTAAQWSQKGYVRFGRLAYESVAYSSTHWCLFSDIAWLDAHAERRAKAGRLLANRTWKMTEEL